MDALIQKLNIWKLIIAIAICELTGVISSLLSNPFMNPWFDNLVNPSWNPPSAVFGPVWSVLYLLMGISLWLVWKSDKAKGEKEIAITFFIIQLFLNFWWSLLFYKFHSPLLALVDIVLLVVLVMTTMVHFFSISKIGTYVLIPYLFWIVFATILNASIVLLNR